MSYTSLLVHKANIQARESRADRLGQPVLTFVDKLNDVPCRLSFDGGGAEGRTQGTRDTVHATHIVFFATDTNIGETDRISLIKDADGSTLAINLEVLHVKKRTGLGRSLHHLEVACALDRGSA